LELVVLFAAVLSTADGRLTFTVGTWTCVGLVPSDTVPVSTSKAGDWPPRAVTPFVVALICGAFASRVWLTSRRPVANAKMRATTARMKMKMIARIVCRAFEPREFMQTTTPIWCRRLRRSIDAHGHRR